MGLDIPVGTGVGKYKDEPILITGGFEQPWTVWYVGSNFPLLLTRMSYGDFVALLIRALYSHSTRKTIGIQPYNNDLLTLQRSLLHLRRRDARNRLSHRALHFQPRPLPRISHHFQHHDQTYSCNL